MYTISGRPSPSISIKVSVTSPSVFPTPAFIPKESLLSRDIGAIQAETKAELLFVLLLFMGWPHSWEIIAARVSLKKLKTATRREIPALPDIRSAILSFCCSPNSVLSLASS